MQKFATTFVRTARRQCRSNDSSRARTLTAGFLHKLFSLARPVESRCDKNCQFASSLSINGEDGINKRTKRTTESKSYHEPEGLLEKKVLLVENPPPAPDRFPISIAKIQGSIIHPRVPVGDPVVGAHGSRLKDRSIDPFGSADVRDGYLRARARVTCTFYARYNARVRFRGAHAAAIYGAETLAVSPPYGGSNAAATIFISVTATP